MMTLPAKMWKDCTTQLCGWTQNHVQYIEKFHGFRVTYFDSRVATFCPLGRQIQKLNRHL